MSKPRVYSKRGFYPPDAVYVGRPTKWGNPFVIGRDGTREEVIDKFEQFIRDDPQLITIVKQELCGKNLCCWCSPAACHGDVLLKIANAIDSPV